MSKTKIIIIAVLVAVGIIWMISSIGTDLRTTSGSFSSVPKN